jgi:hypothetical protein
VCIEKPLGFEVNGKESHVCRLKKAFCALKQAPTTWYSRKDGSLQSMGLTISEVDPNLYYIIVGIDLLVLVLYIDALFLTGLEKLIARCKEDMTTEFEMMEIMVMHHFLGLEVW